MLQAMPDALIRPIQADRQVRPESPGHPVWLLGLHLSLKECLAPSRHALLANSLARGLPQHQTSAPCRHDPSGALTLRSCRHRQRVFLPAPADSSACQSESSMLPNCCPAGQKYRLRGHALHQSRFQAFAQRCCAFAKQPAKPAPGRVQTARRAFVPTGQEPAPTLFCLWDCGKMRRVTSQVRQATPAIRQPRCPSSVCRSRGGKALPSTAREAGQYLRF